MNGSDKLSACAKCAHARKIHREELKGSYKLRCGYTGRFMKDPKGSCKDMEPDTWERFTDDK
ncbi:hypothetical protein [Limisalsivibrio acetivorans]|uniref:hypothetical protein n=1 Tax=Limisalsivibrio acetivorans TaxID=1304888 RepID=UPI0003B4C830|nr:hypothetical protein [Limisalsivibrio acetivorans]